MNHAITNLAEAVGAALLRFAQEARQEAGSVELHLEPPADPLRDVALGKRQQEMVEVLRLAGDEGLTTSQISERMNGYDTANAHMGLRALNQRRVVEEVPGKTPIHWRLAPHYRATADPYLTIAELIGEGEWTTYGDISIAVRGDTQGARAVGRAAATLPHFPHPHRVLQSGGRVPDGWKTSEAEAPNPEVCRERLEAEGVSFDEDGRASRMHYVGWEVLRERRDA